MNEPDDQQPEEKVGYGNPPKHMQFKKGQSGNPKGRPKGSKSLKSVLGDELAREITLTEQGQTSKVTKMEALAKRLVSDALSGNPRALSELMRQVNLHLTDLETVEYRSLPASEEDARLLIKYATRELTEKLSKEANNATSE